MAKLSNVLSKIFGSGAGLNQISKFGSLFAGTPAFTTDPEEAQSLSNYLTGWAAAAIGGNSPAIEDMNAVLFAMSYQLAYYQQSGIPEWNSGKEYFIGSLVNDGTGAIYVSLIDSNTGNAVSDDTKWTKVGGKVMSALGDLIYGGANGAQSALSGNTDTTRKFLSQVGTGAVSAAPSWYSPVIPTMKKYLSGSGSYVSGDDVIYIKVKLVGPGGGGGGASGSGAGNGSNGGNTTFGVLTANGGNGGSGSGGSGGAGGSFNLGGVTDAIGWPGGGGGSGIQSSGPNAGGVGGNSSLGGGAPGPNSSANAESGATNTGGGGAGASTTSSGQSGGGGGAGGTVVAILPAGTYAYALGSAGSGGSSGSGQNASGNGAVGCIEIEEFYQ